MEKKLIKNKLYQMIDQLNERKIIPIKFYLAFLNKIYPFCYEKGSTCKMLFANDGEIMELIDKTEMIEI